MNFMGALGAAVLILAGPRMGIPVLFERNGATFIRCAEALLTVSSSMLGFVIAAVAFLFSMTESAKLAFLKKSPAYPQLGALYRRAAFWLFAAASFGGLGLALGPSTVSETGGDLLIGLMLFVAIQASVSLCGLAWVLGRLVDLV